MVPPNVAASARSRSVMWGTWRLGSRYEKPGTAPYRVVESRQRRSSHTVARISSRAARSGSHRTQASTARTLHAFAGHPDRLRDHDPRDHDEPTNDLQRLERLPDEQPRRDRGDHRLRGGGEPDPRGGDEPHGADAEQVRDHRRDDHDAEHVEPEVAVERGPRQRPRRPDHAPGE